MKMDKVTNLQTLEQTYPKQQGYIMPTDELKRLTDFFSLLIQIDRRVNVTKTYAKPNK